MRSRYTPSAPLAAVVVIAAVAILGFVAVQFLLPILPGEDEGHGYVMTPFEQQVSTQIETESKGLYTDIVTRCLHEPNSVGDSGPFFCTWEGIPSTPPTLAPPHSVEVSGTPITVKVMNGRIVVAEEPWPHPDGGAGRRRTPGK
jgi:hypothetical protein